MSEQIRTETYQPSAEILSRPHVFAERDDDGTITRVVVTVCKRCHQPMPSLYDPNQKACRCVPPVSSVIETVWEPGDDIAEDTYDEQYSVDSEPTFSELLRDAIASADPELNERRQQERQDGGLLHNLPVPEGMPVLDPAALQGIVGDVVCKISPETEAHPVGILVGILQQFGNIIGDSAHTIVEGKSVYGNFFSMKVGKSSKSRKGTGADRVFEFMSEVDVDWAANRQASGLSSGEGLADAVRDDANVTVKGVTKVIPGVADKRLMVVEGEAGILLRNMNRQGSNLSATVRDAADHKRIGGLTKHDKTRCANPHISIAMDITKDELLKELNSVECMNGFGNRFFICEVYRWNILPDGGGQMDWTREVEVIKNRVRRAKTAGCMKRDAEANQVWKKWYKELPDEGGVVASLTARAERFVTIFSMLYALLDGKHTIQREHIRAAIALWNYGVQSVESIFDGVGPDQANIIAFLEEEAGGATKKPDGTPGPQMTATIRDIQRGAFGGRSNVDAIRELMKGLVAKGYAKRHETDGKESYSRDWRKKRVLSL